MFEYDWHIVQQYSDDITTTIDPLSAGLIIISFDLILVITEFNQSLKLGMLSEIPFILIFVSGAFLHMASNS